MKNLLKIFLAAFILISSSLTTLASTGISIIPEVQKDFRSNYSCTIIMKNFEQIYDFQQFQTPNNQPISETQKFKCATENLQKFLEDQTQQLNCPAEIQNPIFKENDILGCSLITGRVRFVYLPRFIVYGLELLTILSGVLSLLFVILGGYYYLINTLSGSDVDKGKSYIKNALFGLVISLSAWSVINLIQIFLTS